MKSKLKLIACALLVLAAGAASAAMLPPGFSESVIASGISNPTAMGFAPDGRLFVCQQTGQLRVIKNDALLATPFLTVTTDFSGERGLLGVAFDPDFAINQRVYIYYTVPSPPHNRVSRFIASGDVAVNGSETVILELDSLSTASNHNGGAIHFGLDGKLYVAVGENANRANAQVVTNRLGKILRINPDGTIPGDNPATFKNASGTSLTTTGMNRAIWALGLRNPFTFGIQPGTGRMFINDVGEGSWEEINEGVAGANYGWPNCEGACSPTNPNLRDPIYQYSHAEGCAIVGAAFYNPVAAQFPPEYTGVYFFADLCGGWIRKLDPDAGNQVSTFATGLSSPVDLAVSADGSLYYLERGSSSVSRVRFTGAPNVVTLTFDTQPSGLQLTLDGQTIDTPYTVESVVGTTLTIGAPSPQQAGKHNYSFVQWSDGGAQTHDITTPGADTIYKATYRKGGRP